MKNNKKYSARGFTLIEIMLVLAVAMIFSVIGLRKIIADQNSRMAEAAGKQLVELNEAMAGYIVTHYQELSNGIAPISPTLLCSTVGSAYVCETTVADLISDGLLPTGYSNAPLFNTSGTWRFLFRTRGTAPNLNVEGLVISTVPFTVGPGGPVARDLLGQAVAVAGPDAGAVSLVGSNLEFTGMGGGFTFSGASASPLYFPDRTGAAAVNLDGQLGARSGTGTAMFNAYLRRDGSLPMLGDLNMRSSATTNHSIVDANNINTTGNVDVGGNLTVAGTATVTGDTTLNAKLTVANDTALNGNLTVAKNTYFGASPNMSFSYASDGQISVDDIYVRRVGMWASEMAPFYVSKAVYLAQNNDLVPKPTSCTAASRGGKGSAGTPKIVVTPANQLVLTNLRKDTSGLKLYASWGYGAAWVDGPDRVTQGEILAKADDVGANWQVVLQTAQGLNSQSFIGGAVYDQAIAHVYCQYNNVYSSIPY